MVPIKPKDDVSNLHGVWDSVLYEFNGYADLPFSDSDWKAQGKDATTLMSKHSIPKSKA